MSLIYLKKKKKHNRIELSNALDDIANVFPLEKKKFIRQSISLKTFPTLQRQIFCNCIISSLVCSVLVSSLTVTGIM